MVERGVAVVVEDDDDIRTTLTEVLQQSGFAVHSTASGVAGVDAVREHNPDIVTMDVGLPDFDGIEASRRIRTFSDAYLIIVSGRVDEADTLMGFEAGADDSEECEGVAEDERERDRQHHGRGVSPGQGGAYDHAEDLADGAAEQAVQRRPYRHRPGRAGRRPVPGTGVLVHGVVHGPHPPSKRHGDGVCPHAHDERYTP